MVPTLMENMFYRPGEVIEVNEIIDLCSEYNLISNLLEMNFHVSEISINYFKLIELIIIIIIRIYFILNKLYLYILIYKI